MNRLLSIIKWPFAKTKADDIWINGFVDWFGSIPGFKQQMMFMFGWIAIALIYPHIDPNMLHLMVFLTIYSGVTQPMIAIQNAHSGFLMMKMIKSQSEQLDALKAMIHAIQKEAK